MRVMGKQTRKNNEENMKKKREEKGKEVNRRFQ